MFGLLTIAGLFEISGLSNVFVIENTEPCNLTRGIRHKAQRSTDNANDVEWITVGLVLLCYLTWVIAIFVLADWSTWFAVIFLVLGLVLHGSLTHEICHGHPLPWRRASEALVQINPGLAVPYMRFRDTHLAHHQDSKLTDPYDDPESNYLDPACWEKMPKWLRLIRRANNTLAGRILIGPALGQIAFMTQDARLIYAGDQHVLRSWLWHVPGCVLVVSVVAASSMPLSIYLMSAYAALSVLKIRTFVEHQAHESARGRTVIIEDRGLLAFLFLNNNLHVVHHMHPQVPWYRLPALYWSNKDRFSRCNHGYVFRSYRQIFALYFLRAKDAVPHPLWPSARD